MLQNIRDNVQGTIAKIIIAIIIVPFALFGVESLVTGGGANDVAEVNGEAISELELQQAIAIQRRNLIQRMGDNIDPSFLDEALLRESSLEQLIQQKLLLQAIDERDMGVSVASVDQVILDMPQFQEDGQFSPQLYQNTLRSSGYTLSYFKELVTNDLLMRQLRQGIAGSDFVTPKELADATRIVAQKRSYAYVTIPVEKLLSTVSVDDTEAQSYFDENQADFQNEEKVKLDYIELKQQDFITEIDEALVREAFEAEVAELDVKEERRVSHILIEINDDRDEPSAKARADEVAARLAKGETFADLAKVYSDDLGSSESGGDLGFTRGDTFPIEFEEALFTLALDEVSMPVKTDSGYHLLRATEIKEANLPTFEERKGAIQARLQLEAAEGEFINQVEALKDLAFNAEGLSSPAIELKLDVRSSNWLTRNDAEGVLADPRVVSAAFSEEVLQDKNNSEVIELKSDHYIVVAVSEHQPQSPKGFDEVKATIVERLKKEKATALANTEADTILEKLKQVEGLTSITEQYDYEVKEEEGVTRLTSRADRSLATAIFSMKKQAEGEASYRRVELSNGDVAVVLLKSVVDGRMEDLADVEKQGMGAQLERGYSTRSLGAFESTVRESADIDVL